MTVILEGMAPGAAGRTTGATLEGARWVVVSPNSAYGLRQGAFSSSSKLIDASGPVRIVAIPDAQPLAASGWLEAAVHRISDLVELPENWDSYGGFPASAQAARAMLRFLSSLSKIVSDGPAISSTPEGGLACEWRRERAQLIVEFDDGGLLCFYWTDERTGEEVEGGIRNSSSLLTHLWSVAR